MKINVLFIVHFPLGKYFLNTLCLSGFQKMKKHLKMSKFINKKDVSFKVWFVCLVTFQPFMDYLMPI